MRRWIAILPALFLAGCGHWSPIIRSEMTDDQSVIENETDALLLVNIIEARDKAPLHFIEVPKVNGSIQANSQLQSIIPFLIKSGTPVAGSVTPQLTIQSNPSFEIDALDTKEFFTGMTTALDPKVVKFLIDQQLDSRLLMLLLVKSIQIQDAKSTATVKNTPRETADFVHQCILLHNEKGMECHARTNFEMFLKIVNAMENRSITANVYDEKTKLARKISLASDDISDFDPSQYKLEPAKPGSLKHKGFKKDSKKKSEKRNHSEPGKFDVFQGATTQKLAICFNGIAVGKEGKPDTAEDLCSDPDAETVEDLTSPDKPKKLAELRLARFPVQEPCSEKSTFGFCEFIERFIKAEKLAKSIGSCSELVDPDALPGVCRDENDHVTFRLAEADRIKSISHILGKYTIKFNLRTVSEIVRYLGDILYYQDTLKSDGDHNVPVTLGFDGKDESDVGCLSKSAPGQPIPPECIQRNDGFFFRVNDPDVPPRFTIAYRGQDFAVGTYTVLDCATEGSEATRHACTKDRLVPVARDHTLEVLSILNFLMNINKSATDIKTTPLVQVVP